MKALLFWAGFFVAGSLFGQVHFERDKVVAIESVFEQTLIRLGVAGGDVAPLGVNVIWSGEGRAELVSLSASSKILVSVLVDPERGAMSARATFAVRLENIAPGKAMLILDHRLIDAEGKVQDESSRPWKILMQDRPGQMDEPPAVVGPGVNAEH